MTLSIKNKFFLLFLAGFILILLCGLLAATWFMKSRADNGSAVNLAGRLGVLSQKISKDAFILTLGVDEARVRLIDENATSGNYEQFALQWAFTF